MAAIVLNSFSAPASGALYRDLLLDLKINYTRNLQLEKHREVKDLQRSEDIGAIKNSLFNLFTTIPGQKILNPIYGLNLLQYLFVPASTSQARIIGEVIFTGVKRFEPRLLIRKVNVEAIEDQNQYNVAMIMDVPSLNVTNVSLNGTLNDSGFYYN